MKTNVLYFGMAADAAKKNSSVYNDCNNTDALKKAIINDCPELKNFNFALAVNKNIVNSTILLNEGDTVAVLPPFSGG